jgi:hypothetical protein
MTRVDIKGTPIEPDAEGHFCCGCGCGQPIEFSPIDHQFVPIGQTGCYEPSNAFHFPVPWPGKAETWRDRPPLF